MRRGIFRVIYFCALMVLDRPMRDAMVEAHEMGLDAYAAKMSHHQNPRETP